MLESSNNMDKKDSNFFFSKIDEELKLLNRFEIATAHDFRTFEERSLTKFLIDNIIMGIIA